MIGCHYGLVKIDQQWEADAFFSPPVFSSSERAAAFCKFNYVFLSVCIHPVCAWGRARVSAWVWVGESVCGLMLKNSTYFFAWMLWAQPRCPLYTGVTNKVMFLVSLVCVCLVLNTKNDDAQRRHPLSVTSDIRHVCGAEPRVAGTSSAAWRLSPAAALPAVHVLRYPQQSRRSKIKQIL